MSGVLHRVYFESFANIDTSCVALHAIIFDEIFPVYAAQASPNGLGFSAHDIAAALAAAAPVIFLTQLVLFPMLMRRLATTTLWRGTAIAFMVIYPCFSIIPDVRSKSSDNDSIIWPLLLVLLCMRFVMHVISFTSIAVLVRKEVAFTGLWLTAAQINQIAIPEYRGFIMG